MTSRRLTAILEHAKEVVMLIRTSRYDVLFATPGLVLSNRSQTRPMIRFLPIMRYNHVVLTRMRTSWRYGAGGSSRWTGGDVITASHVKIPSRLSGPALLGN